MNGILAWVKRCISFMGRSGLMVPVPIVYIFHRLLDRSFALVSILLVFTAVTLFASFSANAAITQIQKSQFADSTSGPTTTNAATPFPALPTVGNTIVVYIWSWGGNNVANPISVTDSSGNPYTVAPQINASVPAPGYQTAAILSTIVQAASAPFVITVHSANTGPAYANQEEIGAVAVEYSGLAGMDIVNTVTGTAAHASITLGATTNNNNELVAAIVSILGPATNFTSITPSPLAPAAGGWTVEGTSLQNANFSAGQLADLTLTSPGNPTITWTASSNLTGWAAAMVSFNPIINCTSVQSGNWSNPATWTNCNSSYPTAGATATINAGHTVTLDISPPNLTSVTIASGAVLTTTAANTLTVGRIAGASITNNGTISFGTLGSIALGGNLTLAGSGSWTVNNVNAGAYTLDASALPATTNIPVNGNFTSTGTFKSGSGTWTFAGTTAQTITGTMAFTNLALNNASGLILSGTSNIVTVSNTLTLTQGSITTGTNTLFYSPNCMTTPISFPGGYYVNGNLKLTIPNTNPATCVFPVGDSKNYAPITYVKTGTNTGTLTGATTGVSTSNTLIYASVVRTWSLTVGTLAATTPYSATFQFCNAVGAGCGVNDVASGANYLSFIVAEEVGTTWSKPTVGTLTATSIQATGLTTYGLFNVGTLIPTGPDHYELSMPTTGITCLPVTVTVTACADTSSPCTNNFSSVSGKTAVLTASAGTLGASPVTFGATGVATTTLSYPAAANNTATSVTLSGEQLAGTNSRKCCPNGTACTVSNSCSTTFNTAGFIFSNTAATSSSPSGTSSTIPTQVAGTPSGKYYLQAVKTSSTTMACQAALTGMQSVNIGYTCSNPNTCNASSLLDITPYNGVSVQTTQTVAPGSSAVNLYFDGYGNAPFTFNYRDVGYISINPSKSASGALLTTLTGPSNSFYVNPASFGVIPCTATTGGICTTAPPDPGLTGTGSIFAKAGNPFYVTVTALTSGGGGVAAAATPSFGLGTNNGTESVSLGHTIQAPTSGANDPALGGTTSIFRSSFTNGIATLSNVSWNEVGVITLSATNNTFLGQSVTTTGTSGNVGRFIPDHFETAIVQTGTSPAFVPMTCPSGLTCPATYNGMVYSGQPFSVKVSARNTTACNGSSPDVCTTQNYQGSFAKTVTLQAWDALGSIVTQNPPGTTGTLANNSISSGITAGVATTATPTYTFPTVTTPPTNIYVRAGDTDGVSSRQTVPANSVEGGVMVVNGRMVINNAYGSELLSLTVPVAAQYWNGTYWALSSTDSSSKFSVSDVVFSGWLKAIGSSGSWNAGPTPPQSTNVSSTSPITFSGGQTSFVLSSPGYNNTGSVNITANGTVSPSTSAYLPSNSALIRFGVYKGNSHLIYLREY